MRSTHPCIPTTYALQIIVGARRHVEVDSQVDTRGIYATGEHPRGHHDARLVRGKQVVVCQSTEKKQVPSYRQLRRGANEARIDNACAMSVYNDSRLASGKQVEVCQSTEKNKHHLTDHLTDSACDSPSWASGTVLRMANARSARCGMDNACDMSVCNDSV